MNHVAQEMTQDENMAMGYITYQFLDTFLLSLPQTSCIIYLLLICKVGQIEVCLKKHQYSSIRVQRNS